MNRSHGTSSHGTSLKGRVTSGFAWTMTSQFLVQGITYFTLAVLARLLSPNDFGLMGMIAIFAGFAQLFNKLGFGQALIQKLDAGQDHYSSVFWVNLVIGAILTLVMIALAPLISAFYNEAQLTNLTIAIAFTFFISSTMIVQQSLLQKRLQYRKLSVIRLVSTLTGSGVAIMIALAGGGVWSLVGQNISLILCTAILAWVATDWRPSWGVDFSALKSLFRYSANISGQTMIEYWTRNADNLLVGKCLGSDLLGIYGRAYNLALFPIMQLLNVGFQVMYPALASIQVDLDRVRRTYFKMVSMMAFVALPVMLGLIVVAEPFVYVLLGPKWADVIPVLRYLCVVGLLRAITNPGAWIFQSQGRVDIMLRWEMIRTPLLIAGFAAGVYLGDIVRLAQIYAILTFLLLYLDLALPGRIIQAHVRDALSCIIGPSICAVLMAAVMVALDRAVLNSLSSWLRLLIEVAVGGGIYWMGVHVFRIGAYYEFTSLLREYRQGLRRAPQLEQP